MTWAAIIPEFQLNSYDKWIYKGLIITYILIAMSFLQKYEIRIAKFEAN